MSVIESQLWIEAQQVRNQRAHLGESLDTSKATTYDNEGQQTVARWASRQLSSLVHVLDDAVANLDGLFDCLHADAVVGNTRNRECAADGTGGNDYVVVLELVRLQAVNLNGGNLLLVINVGDLAADQLGLLEVTTVRGDHVACFNRATDNLWQEWLVGQVWQRVNHCDLGLALAKQLLELECGVETGVTATYDKDAWRSSADVVLRHIF